MDIKLVKNFEEGMYIPVNREMLLQVIDDNRRFEEFNGKRIFLFNPLTNERFEIMPEIPKFNVTKVYYGEEERDYFVFTSARMINERETEITYYWYQISLQESSVIHTQTVSTESLKKNGALKTFILSQDYCIFENKGDNFELILRDVKNNAGTRRCFSSDDLRPERSRPRGRSRRKRRSRCRRRRRSHTGNPPERSRPRGRNPRRSRS